MKNKILAFSGYILLVIVAVVFGFYLVNKINQNDDEIIIFGNVDIRQADLGFRVFGRVEKLLHDEGDELKTGDLMAVLDKIPYEEELAQARAKVSETESELKKAKAQFQKRYQVLSEAISKEDYDNALFNLETLQASYEKANASLDSALTNLEDTQIFCPTDGIVLTRIREPGTIVNVGDPVYTLSVKSPVWIRAFVTEPNLGRIYPGMHADIFTDSTSGIAYKGHIGFISPVAEFTPKNVETLDLRTDLVYRLRIIVDNPDKWIRQGMPVTVKLKLKGFNQPDK